MNRSAQNADLIHSLLAPGNCVATLFDHHVTAIASDPQQKSRIRFRSAFEGYQVSTSIYSGRQCRRLRASLSHLRASPDFEAPPLCYRRTPSGTRTVLFVQTSSTNERPSMGLRFRLE